MEFLKLLKKVNEWILYVKKSMFEFLNYTESKALAAVYVLKIF